MFIGSSTNLLSPCTGQCNLNEQDICTGCFRTGQEISNWFEKSDDERIAIVIRCKKQMAQSQNNSE